MSWLEMKTLTSTQLLIKSVILFSYTGLVVRCHWECIHTQEEVHGHQARGNSHWPEQYISLFLPYTQISYKNYIKKKQQQNKSLFFYSKKRKKKKGKS